MTGLAAEFDTTFVTFEHHPDSPDGYTSREQLAQVLPGVEVITVPGLGAGKRLAQARTLASRRSWTYGRYVLPQFHEALRSVVRRRRPGIVHFDDLGVGQHAPVDAPLNVFAPHNIEHRIIRGEAQVARGVRQAFAEIEWRKLAREERELWRTVPLCLAVSETDAETMRAAGARRVVVCPNGADAVPQLPTPTRERGEPLRLLFLGSGSYRPYENGIAWFVRNVLPLIQQYVPTQFDVVGRPPNRPVVAPGVRYVGPVEVVRPWYERAHAVVVPTFEGSGTRLKIVEALAHGRPAVSTRLGAEGLPICAGEHYWEAGDAQSFVAALTEIAIWSECRDDRLAAVIARAREAVAPLSWPLITKHLALTYHRALEEREPSPSAPAARVEDATG